MVATVVEQKTSMIQSLQHVVIFDTARTYIASVNLQNRERHPSRRLHHLQKLPARHHPFHTSRLTMNWPVSATRRQCITQWTSRKNGVGRCQRPCFSRNQYIIFLHYLKDSIPNSGTTPFTRQDRHLQGEIVCRYFSLMFHRSAHRGSIDIPTRAPIPRGLPCIGNHTRFQQQTAQSKPKTFPLHQMRCPVPPLDPQCRRSEKVEFAAWCQPTAAEKEK